MKANINVTGRGNKHEQGKNKYEIQADYDEQG
jgi:hypothetical protein